MLAIAIVAGLLAGYIAVRIIVRTGGPLAHVLSRGPAAVGRTWRRADWLGRLTQFSGWSLLAALVLLPTGGAGTASRLGRNITLTVLAVGLLTGALALLVRRAVRRIHRPRDDERAWHDRELLYGDANRKGHDVLLVDSEQYRVG